MSELKPCPFCGGEAVVNYFPDSLWDKFTVCCKNHKCPAFYIGYVGEGLYPTREKSIEAWNERAEIVKVYTSETKEHYEWVAVSPLTGEGNAECNTTADLSKNGR